MLDDLHGWLVDWADSRAGPAALSIVAAAESVAFPLPPDPLLIALALRNPDTALFLAALATVASVAGGMVGHWLGKRFGRPLLLSLHSGRIERIESMFQRHGFWTIAIAGLTPIPYKVFTISAGVFDIPRLQFVLASILGRGLRFGAYGVLIFFWGNHVGKFLSERFDMIVSAVAAGLVAGAIGWLIWKRSSRESAKVELPYDGS